MSGTVFDKVFLLRTGLFLKQMISFVLLCVLLSELSVQELSLLSVVARIRTAEGPLIRAAMVRSIEALKKYSELFFVVDFQFRHRPKSLDSNL